MDPGQSLSDGSRLGSLSHSRSLDCFLGRRLGDHDCGSGQHSSQVAGHDHELATHLVNPSCATTVSCGLLVPRGNVPVDPLIATRTPEYLFSIEFSSFRQRADRFHEQSAPKAGPLNRFLPSDRCSSLDAELGL